MNLRVRLNLLITVILLIFFVSMGYTIMKGSKESIQEGVESANRVTMQLLDTVIISSAQNPEWGYTPHTIFSRLGDWRLRFGPRPGLMLVAALISRHVDEVLRLINHNNRVGAIWRRNGGPLLVRHLLYSHQSPATLLPATVDGRDIGILISRFLPILDRFGGERLKADIAYYRNFVRQWPGADLGGLDSEALRLGGKS